MDSRNHGDSPHSKDMSYNDMAEDVAAFMEDVGLDSGIFLGHSMGGSECKIVRHAPESFDFDNGWAIGLLLVLRCIDVLG